MTYHDHFVTLASACVDFEEKTREQNPVIFMSRDYFLKVCASSPGCITYDRTTIKTFMGHKIETVNVPGDHLWIGEEYKILEHIPDPQKED